MSDDQNNLKNIIMDESFQRWLSGTASDDEKAQWTRWLEENPVHRQYLAEAKEIWQLGQFAPSSVPDIEQELERLKWRLDLPARQAAAIRRSKPEKFRRQPRLRRPYLASAGALAVLSLLIFLLTRSTFFNRIVDSNKGVVSTEFGQRTRITLSEGTVIILNANSSLRYPTNRRYDSARLLHLKGEAYFDVAPIAEDLGENFVVYTADGAVEVVGTRFVVYERGNGTRIVVEEGSVQALPGKIDESATASADAILLHIGAWMEFHKDGRQIVRTQQNASLAISWWRDVIVLDDTPFEQVIRRLEETFGIQVIVDDESIKKRTLTGSIENRNLEVIANGVAKALDLRMQQDGKILRFTRASLDEQNR